MLYLIAYFFLLFKVVQYVRVFFRAGSSSRNGTGRKGKSRHIFLIRHFLLLTLQKKDYITQVSNVEKIEEDTFLEDRRR